MNQNQFLEQFLSLDICDVFISAVKFPLNVTVTRISGKPSLAIIEAQLEEQYGNDADGSRLSIILDVSGPQHEFLGPKTFTHLNGMFLIDGVKVRKTAKNRGKSIQLIYQFLLENNHI